jgi:hypothetical protein
MERVEGAVGDLRERLDVASPYSRCLAAQLE